MKSLIKNVRTPILDKIYSEILLKGLSGSSEFEH